MPKTVVIRCVETGRDVPTGIAADQTSFESLAASNNSTSCPYCEKTHVWSRENLRLVTSS